MGNTAGRYAVLWQIEVHMRFDVPIVFTKYGDVYDSATGDYTTSVVNEDTRYASVDSTTERMMTLVYGGVRQDSITVRIQNHYDGDFDDIVIDGKAYKVDYRRPLRVKDVFVLSRV